MPLKHVSAGSVQTSGKSEQGPKSTKGFPEALGSIPPELWEIFLMNSTWAGDRTIMLRMTSKKVREAVDKIRPPAVVCLSKSFWNGTAAVKLQFVVRKLILRKGTAAEKLKFVFSKLALMTVWSRITTLELHSCEMKGTARLAGVLPQCPALVHLDLRGNYIGAVGAGTLAGVLPQCRALAHLNLWGNTIRDKGAESLAGVLAHCPALAHLNLSGNEIGARGAESLAGVLGLCRVLVHLNLLGNLIGPGGAESLAGVLAQCTALAHLDLRVNDIGTVGEGRLRASWRGQASRLLL
jgi:hypothetical protein